MSASGSLRRSAWWAGAALAVASLAACVAERAALPVVRSADSSIDRATCEGRYVTSIWKGLDSSGPECAGYLAAAGRETRYDRGRIQRVCEHAELRMILTGEASTAFTQQACSAHQTEYQLATLHRACRQVSRARTDELTPAQSAACERYLGAAAASPARITAGADPVRTGPRPSPLAGIAGALASPAEPAIEAAEDAPSCEDRYVESIWKGEDLQDGSQCAALAGPAAGAPHYRLARIQNVCEGAEVRAIRRGEALPPFTQQACGALLEALHASAAATPSGAAAAAEPSAAAAPDAPIGTGLDEAAITRTVDANWRSIGRHCWSVAPRRSIPWAPANTEVTVTLTVAASGQVQDVSARAGGRSELERCIESSIRLWQFPAAGSDTLVELPLLFAGE